MAEPTTLGSVCWKRVLECDFNRRYYIMRAKRYRVIRKVYEGGILFLSSAAVLTWVTPIGAGLPQILSIVTALLAAIVVTTRPADDAARYNAQAEQWSELWHQYKKLHHASHDSGASSDADMEALERTFIDLFKQVQEDPKEKITLPIQEQVLLSHGYTQEYINSLIWA